MDPNKLPKTLRKYAAKIDDYSDERGSQSGIWCYLVPGLKSYLDPLGCEHQVHEETLGECAQGVRWAVPCDCAECLQMLAARTA